MLGRLGSGTGCSAFGAPGGAAGDSDGGGGGGGELRCDPERPFANLSLSTPFPNPLPP